MKTELRYAGHPADVKGYDTERIRREFLVSDVFVQDEISLVYSLYDRYIVGGVMPVERTLRLEPVDELKATEFLDRREMGLINVGGSAEITAGGVVYHLGHKEALYLGKGTGNVAFKSTDILNPAKKTLHQFCSCSSCLSPEESHPC